MKVLLSFIVVSFCLSAFAEDAKLGDQLFLSAPSVAVEKDVFSLRHCFLDGEASRQSFYYSAQTKNIYLELDKESIAAFIYNSDRNGAVPMGWSQSVAESVSKSTGPNLDIAISLVDRLKNTMFLMGAGMSGGQTTWTELSKILFVEDGTVDAVNSMTLDELWSKEIVGVPQNAENVELIKKTALLVLNVMSYDGERMQLKFSMGDAENIATAVCKNNL